MSVLCLHGLVPIGPLDTAAEVPSHQAVALGPLMALVSEMEEKLEDESASLGALLAHDMLLGRYLARGPVLPVQFGTFFSDVTALTGTLAPQAALLAQRLEALTGLAEYALSVEPGGQNRHDSTAKQPLPTSGRAFLKARQQQRDRRTMLNAERDRHLRALHDRASAMARDSDLRPPHPSRLMSLSLLMHPDEATALRDMLEDWRRTSGMAGRLIGPFPPYSFADLSQESAADVRKSAS